MTEVFWNHNDDINSIDIKGDKIQDWFHENIIKDKAKEYLKSKVKEWISGKDYNKLLKLIKQILERQDIERLNLQEEPEKQRAEVIWETRMHIENEKKTQIVQNMIYSELKIDGNLENNTNPKKFVKWVVDWLILHNIELVEELISKWIDDLVWMLKNLFNPEILKKIIKDLVSSLWDILDTFQNPYEWWVAVWWMWLWIF